MTHNFVVHGAHGAWCFLSGAAAPIMQISAAVDPTLPTTSTQARAVQVPA